MLQDNRARAALGNIRAFVWDNDDFFTRCDSGHEKYYSAAHNAVNHHLALNERANDQIALEAWKALHQKWYFKGDCIFTRAAEHFQLNAKAIFNYFNDTTVTSDIIHDTASAPAVMAYAGCSVILTDASYVWAWRSTQKTGIDLPILARDFGGRDTLQPLKAQGPERFELARRMLSDRVGHDLQPHEILFGDDSGKALRVAKECGHVTLQSTYGFPNNPPCEHADFMTDHVGTWLIENSPHMPRLSAPLPAVLKA